MNCQSTTFVSHDPRTVCHHHPPHMCRTAKRVVLAWWYVHHHGALSIFFVHGVQLGRRCATGTRLGFLRPFRQAVPVSCPALPSADRATRSGHTNTALGTGAAAAHHQYSPRFLGESCVGVLSTGFCFLRREIAVMCCVMAAKALLIRSTSWWVTGILWSVRPGSISSPSLANRKSKDQGFKLSGQRIQSSLIGFISCTLTKFGFWSKHTIS